MFETTIETFGFPAIGRKKLVAAFDGGRLTSDGGVMLLAAVERDMGVAEHFAGLIADPRNPACSYRDETPQKCRLKIPQFS